MVDQRVPSNDPRSLCESKLGPVSSFLKWWICVIRFFVTFWTTRYCGLNYICSLPSYRKALSNREWKANSLTWNFFYSLAMCDTHFHVQSVCNSPQFESEDLEIRKFSRSSPRRGRSAGLFPDQRLVIEPIYFMIVKNQRPYLSPIPKVFFFFFIHSTVWRAKRSALENSLFFPLSSLMTSI